ncbi:MAG: response regulator transcription factor [Actinobacteria bacterium]|nr:MAG: response regulator transcription factor [Actinomycetota bacterium]
MSEQTVLVVDDEEAIAEAVRARLESEGYRVVVALDGPEAIEAHREHQPDLVVLDLMLPGMDGLEVCKQIQRDRWTPVLMLTVEGVPDQETGPSELHGLNLDAARRRVEVDGEEIALTPLEFEILLALAREPGVVLSRDQLMDRVWGYRDYAGGRVVDSHVARIRRKLGEDGNDPRFIRTVHGVGYAFKE